MPPLACFAIQLLLIGAFWSTRAHALVCSVPVGDDLATKITQAAQLGCSTLELDSGAIYAVQQAIVLDTPLVLAIRTSGSGNAAPARVNLRESVRFLIVTNGADVTVSNVELYNGHAETHSGMAGHGGTFYASGEATRVTLDRVSVFDSVTLVGDGGAVYIDYHAQLAATNCTFVNCSSRERHGGAVALGMNGRAVFENVMFSQNQARLHGGGIYVGVAARVSCSRCTLLENVALEGNGGATFCDNTALLEFSGENRLCSNQAPKGLGGGSFAPYGLSLQWLPMDPTYYIANRNGGRLSNESSTANIALWPPYSALTGFVESIDMPQDASCTYERADKRLAR